MLKARGKNVKAPSVRKGAEMGEKQGCGTISQGVYTCLREALGMVQFSHQDTSGTTAGHDWWRWQG